MLEAVRAAGLGADAPLPVYAHLPLLHGPDGKKLSKRHGAASVQELRDAGYLPEAVRNYLALLGWGAGDDETVLSTEELIERFTLERVSRNPARFDEAKLRWLNGVYMRELPVAELTRAAWKRSPGATGLRRAAAISQEKIQTLADFWPLAGSCSTARGRPAARERWLDEDGRARAGGGSRRARGSCPSFDEAGVEAALEGVIEAARRSSRARSTSRCAWRSPARTVSPGIFETVALLGRDETLARIDAALAARLRAGSRAASAQPFGRGCRYGSIRRSTSPASDRTTPKEGT